MVWFVAGIVVVVAGIVVETVVVEEDAEDSGSCAVASGETASTLSLTPPLLLGESTMVPPIALTLSLLPFAELLLPPAKALVPLPSARLSELFPPGDWRTRTANGYCSPPPPPPPPPLLLPSTLLPSSLAAKVTVTAGFKGVLTAMTAATGRILVSIVIVRAVAPEASLCTSMSSPCPGAGAKPCSGANPGPGANPIPCLFNNRLRSPFHRLRSKFINCNNLFREVRKEDSLFWDHRVACCFLSTTDIISENFCSIVRRASVMTAGLT